MTNQEFSDQFDVLYNNITSNQAPGLDEYEKSVFLTKAQNEIVKAFFTPTYNKSRDGFDSVAIGGERRQIDFSMIMRTKSYMNTSEDVRVSLSDSSATVLYDSAGVLLEDEIPGTTATVYDSGEEVTEGVVWLVSADGCTATISQEGVVSISEMTEDTATVTITAVYNGSTYSSTYTLSKATDVKYDLTVDVSTITVDAYGEASTKTIVATVTKTTADGTETADLDEEGLFFFVSYDGDGALHKASIVNPFTITLQDSQFPQSSVEIYLVEGDISSMSSGSVSGYTVVDMQTVQIIEKEDIVDVFEDAVLDNRSNSKRVSLDNDILMFINEFADVTRTSPSSIVDANVRLTVIPLNYTEYSRLMSKPFKRPLHYQAWRVIDNADSTNKAEIVVGPNDTLVKYTIRYIKKPRAIILSNLEGVSLDGQTEEQTCELDTILHEEILQRAVELAKTAYGDADNAQLQYAAGISSATPMGIMAGSSQS